MREGGGTGENRKLSRFFSCRLGRFALPVTIAHMAVDLAGQAATGQAVGAAEAFDVATAGGAQLKQPKVRQLAKNSGM